MVHQRVAGVSEIAPGKSKLVMAGGQAIAVFNVDGKFFAISEACTHRGGPLHEGYMDGPIVTCPWHGGQFDVTTGQNVGPPAPRPATTYKVSVQGSDIFIDL